MFRLTYRDILIGVLITLLALLLRGVVLVDRARADTAFDPPPPGVDQRHYILFAEAYEAGRWPDAPFHFQPGLVYFLVGSRALFGHSIAQMTLGMVVAGSLACGLMVGVGWLLTRRRWGGYLAGGLLAVYPIAIFYSTVLLTEGLASSYVTLFLLLALWNRERPALWRSALLGLTVGLATITRTNLALLWPAGALLLWLDTRRVRPFLIHAVFSLLFMALAIAPVTYWNWKSSGGHDFPLVTSTGADEVYRANNRDASGLRADEPAMDTVDVPYLQALIADIRLAPLRFIELQLHKAGIYWSALEPSNNVDYVGSGLNVSPLLAAIPLNFGLIALLGWLGVLALWRSDPRAALFFAAVNLLIFAGVMTIWVEGRLKQPAVPPLIATTAYLMVLGVAQFRERRIGSNFLSPPPNPLPAAQGGGLPIALPPSLVPGLPERGRSGEGPGVRMNEKTRGLNPLSGRFLRRALPVAATFLIFGGLNWSISHLPVKLPVGGLPPDAHPVGAVFDGKIRLDGWRALPEWPVERGWTETGKSYAVELFWEVLQPVADDYQFYLAYVQDGQRVAGRDRAIGGIGFPANPTSRWAAGQIYSEIAGFRLPKDTPTGRSGPVQVGVYRLVGADADGQNGTVVDVPVTSADEAQKFVVLQSFAVYPPQTPPDDALADLKPTPFIFGDSIALKGYHLPETARPGETVTLTLGWAAVADVPGDYTLFLHVMDADDTLAVGLDRQPLDGRLLTSTWRPGDLLRDAMPITMPTQPGTYKVYLGLYDSHTHERLPVDAPDNRPLLATITVG
jgi:4-amino-4-deoxy-L-arabinose transferase-like glycosyltransferase